MSEYPTKYQEGYTKLLTYQQGMQIYQKTKYFTANYLDRIRDSRLISHMNDSARSIASNIREGAKRRDTKAYLEFLGYARGSLEELKGDFEELKREIGNGERWSNRDKEGKIGIQKEIEGLLDLIYGEDCMLGRQISALERKMERQKTLPQSELIRRGWKSSRLAEERFWKFAKEKFGIERDEKGLIRQNKDRLP